MPLKVPIAPPDRDVCASASPFSTAAPTSGSVFAFSPRPLSHLGEIQ